MRTKKQLGQVSPADTSATNLYKAPSGISADVQVIVICNYTPNEVTYSIFNDKDGTDATNATALFNECPLSSDSTEVIEFDRLGIIVDPGGSIEVKCDTANSITFTAYGEEIAR